MYTQHFKFSEPPFSIAPNPRYLYLSPQHREALAHLLYGISVGGGFVALTGEVGTGKTTLCRCLLEQLPEDVDIALIFNPRLNSRELLASICDELRIAYPGAGASLKQLIDVLNHHLLETHARGRRTIVLIDEAQNLSFEVLEQIRLLTNLETNRAKLLQIILVGQPELNQVLKRPNLRQLSQRITARYHLNPLSLRETGDYIRHRLKVGGSGDPIFTGPAVGEIHRRSGGIPRLINVICDRALLGAYTLGRTRVSWRIARKAAGELLPAAPARASPLAGISALVLAAAAAGLAYFDILPEFPGLAHLEAVAGAGLSGDGNPAEKPGRQDQGKPGQNTAVAAAGSDIPREAIAQVSPAPKPPEAIAAGGAGVEGPKPPAASEPAVSLAQLLASPDLSRTQAFVRLLNLWKLEPAGDVTDACGFAVRHGLRCLPVHGSWLQLRSFNHPAVLELVLPDGTLRYAALAGLRDGRAELALPQGNKTFDPAEILSFWKGDSVLLWKPPGGAAKPLAAGSRSEAVKWVRQRLHEPAPPGQEDYFDGNLKARVMAFQRERGLAPDGVVGAHTMIYLGMKSDNPGPPRLEPVLR
jgi:general secretion pathway protein A